MTAIQTPAHQSRFSQEDKEVLAGLAGRITVRGQIGSVKFGNSDQGDEFASLMPVGDGWALYGVGMGPEDYHLIDSSDGEPPAEGARLEEVLRALRV